MYLSNKNIRNQSIVVLKHVNYSPYNNEEYYIISFEELIIKIKKISFFPFLFRYSEAILFTPRIETIYHPFITACLLRLLSWKSCRFIDAEGKQCGIGLIFLFNHLGKLLRDYFKRKSFLNSVSSELSLLEKSNNSRERKTKFYSKAPIYLRTDLCYGTQSGGSVAHTAGVLNELFRWYPDILFITTAKIPSVNPEINIYIVDPPERFWNFLEIPALYFNRQMEKSIITLYANRTPAFIYQRYSLNNYVGLKMAQYFHVPLVLEYNGSEIWINRNWGQALKYEQLSKSIENLNLAAADIIVVVSEVMKQELLVKGIEEAKILVNPNGVDPTRYSQDISADTVIQTYGLQGKIVVGFIGTFGQWHGVEQLVHAYALLLQAVPDLKEKIRLLLIGDGYVMPQVKELIHTHGLQKYCILTGLVPQEKGPAYLSACDILVSPHVPNPDGTPFFGSPTKLFEYMAMGKSIIASSLGQIAEIIRHEETGLLVEPGNVNELRESMLQLTLDEDKRRKLGRTAREDVLSCFTWEKHTQRMLNRLQDLYLGLNRIQD